MQDQQHSPDVGATQVYCPRCGQAMLVAPQHTRTTVACPHCQNMLEPWRVMATLAGRRENGGAGPHSAAVTPRPPGAPAYPYARSDGVLYSTRNRWIAGALGLLLGEFGVHRFYLGHIEIGVIQIVVTLATCGIGGLWGFIEGILCFFGAIRDVEGLPLRG